jgi:hypothetical protein
MAPQTSSLAASGSSEVATKNAASSSTPLIKRAIALIGWGASAPRAARSPLLPPRDNPSRRTRIAPRRAGPASWPPSSPPACVASCPLLHSYCMYITTKHYRRQGLGRCVLVGDGPVASTVSTSGLGTGASGKRREKPLGRVMNSAEKPHQDADSAVSSVHRRYPVFRIRKLF